MTLKPGDCIIAIAKSGGALSGSLQSINWSQNLPRTRLARLQFSQITLYSGLLAMGLLGALLLFFPSGLVSPLFQAFLLLSPIPAAIWGGIKLYRRRAHIVLEYDENGFTLNKGSSISIEHNWSEFDQVSITVDSYGGKSLRLYYEPGGLYLDLPISKVGGNPFGMRDFVTRRLKGGSG